MALQYEYGVWGGDHGELEAVMETWTDASVGYVEVLSVKLRRSDGTVLNEEELDDDLLEDIVDQLLGRLPTGCS